MVCKTPLPPEVPEDLELHVRNRLLSHPLFSWLASRWDEIELDDSEFAERFAIESKRPGTARQIFGCDELQQVFLSLLDDNDYNVKFSTFPPKPECFEDQLDALARADRALEASIESEEGDESGY